MSRGGWRILQGVVVAGLLWFVGAELWSRWAELAAVRAQLRPRWSLIAASGGAVLASYLVLIWTWQRTVAAWGERLSFADAARIWFISNLGRYVPGKVWQIGAMGVLAQRAGTSPVAAVGSSLVVSLVNVLAGFAVAGVAGAGALDFGWKGGVLLAVLAAGLLLAPGILPVAARVARSLLKRDIPEPKLPHSAVWIAAAGCVVAWCIYGIAFRVFHVALLGHATGNLGSSTAAFTASYLAGFLFLPAPGGVGVREASLAKLLDQFGIASGAEAWVLVLASRVWLTVLEVVPGVLYLAFRPARGAVPPSPPSNEAHRAP